MTQIVQIKNHSTVVGDPEAIRVVAACQKQVSRDLKRVYGLDAMLSFANKNATLGTFDWQLLIVDDADQAGALGYHETTANGTPIGYCFAKTTKDDGGSWSVTFSHELLELLGDPEINRCVLDEASNRLYAEELCDACEDDSLAYDIDGVKVSDFVLPGFWLGSTKPHSPLSFTGAVTKPLQILPGGYLAFLDMKNPGNGWQQHTARQQAAERGEDPSSYADGNARGSRFARRGIPRAIRSASA